MFSGTLLLDFAFLPPHKFRLFALYRSRLINYRTKGAKGRLALAS